MNIARKIYNCGREVTEQEAYDNKYLFMAWKYGKPYVLVDNQVVIHNRLYEELPQHIVKFINEQKTVLFMYNGMGGVLRSMTDKKFLTLGQNSFYGIFDLTPEFKYGDPIIVVEGAVDRDYCAEKFHRNTLGMLTSGLSRLQEKLLANLTNKVILAHDFDEIGRRGVKNDTKRLNSLGIETKVLPSFGVKDFGDVLEFERIGKQWELTSCITQVSMALRSLV